MSILMNLDLFYNILTLVGCFFGYPLLRPKIHNENKRDQRSIMLKNQLSLESISINYPFLMPIKSINVWLENPLSHAGHIVWN